jgi:hypothetical protein
MCYNPPSSGQNDQVTCWKMQSRNRFRFLESPPSCLFWFIIILNKLFFAVIWIFSQKKHGESLLFFSLFIYIFLWGPVTKIQVRKFTNTETFFFPKQQLPLGEPLIPYVILLSVSNLNLILSMKFRSPKTHQIPFHGQIDFLRWWYFRDIKFRVGRR